MSLESRRRSAVSTGNWMWTLFLTGTPLFQILEVLVGVLAYGILLTAESPLAALLTTWQKWAAMGAALVVPCVSLLVWLFTAIFSRKPSKRRWALANIIWLVIVVVALLLLYVFFQDQILNFIDTLVNTPITSLGAGA